MKIKSKRARELADRSCDMGYTDEQVEIMNTELEKERAMKLFLDLYGVSLHCRRNPETLAESIARTRKELEQVGVFFYDTLEPVPCVPAIGPGKSGQVLVNQGGGRFSWIVNPGGSVSDEV